MKITPVFKFQRFVDDPDEDRKQLLAQLSQMYVQIANAINSIIDDASFFTKERITSDIWVDGKPIWTYTVATGALNAATTSVVLDIKPGPTNYFKVIEITGSISDGTENFTSTYLPLPNTDGTSDANEISLTIVGSGTSVAPVLTLEITSGGTNYAAYTGYVTVYYTKA